MGKVLWLIIALAFGAMLGTTLRPGFPEIVIIAFTLMGMAYGYRSMSVRSRRRVAASS